MSEPGIEVSPTTRLTAPSGRLPLGVIFAAATAGGVGLVGFLHLDRLPLSVCFLKFATGCPCPTCGATRAMGRLFAGDIRGAFVMNPLATAVAFLVVAWGAADLALWPAGRSLSPVLPPTAGRVLRFTVVALVLANWAYLIAAGR
ncbi:MAG: DUF2752 domain-containing protein [Vicinamibacteria bacterium]